MVPRPSCCCWSPAALIVMHRAHTNTQVFCELHARFLSMTQQVQGIYFHWLSNVGRHRDRVHAEYSMLGSTVGHCLRLLLLLILGITSTALRWQPCWTLAPYFSLLHLFSSSFQLSFLPSFLSFLSSLPTGSPSIIFPACSSAPHLTLLCMFSGGFSLFFLCFPRN